MAKSYEVLNYLRPNGGWIQRGQDYEGIEFIEAEPLTKEEYEAAFSVVDALNAEKKAESDAKREAALSKLAALGLTADDLRALGL